MSNNSALKLFSCCRSSWCLWLSSSNQPIMRMSFSHLGLKGSVGQLLWPPSSGFLCVPFTRCGSFLVHSCRWHLPLNKTFERRTLLLLEIPVFSFLIHFTEQHCVFLRIAHFDLFTETEVVCDTTCTGGNEERCIQWKDERSWTIGH